MKKNIISILIPVAAVALSSLLVITPIDRKVADIFQRPLPSTKESDSVVMLNVDDATVENVGTYPLGREVYAKTLVQLKELQAGQAVFDLSFIDKGLAKVDERYVSEDLTDFIKDSFSRMNDGNISSSAAMNDILLSVAHIVRNPDEEFADSLKYFDDSFLTLTFGTGAEPDEKMNSFLFSNLHLYNVTAENDTKTPSYKTVTPAIWDFITNAKSAGFVNGDPDSDGYLRRIHLLVKYNGEYYGQLVFVPLLQKLGNPVVKVSNSKIILQQVDLGDGKKVDLEIPRAEDGSVLLKYPKKKYDDYNSISLWNVYRLQLLEDQLSSIVSEMNENGFFTLWNNENPADGFSAFNYLREELFKGEDSGNGITWENYRTYKKDAMKLLSRYLTQENENEIFSAQDFDEESKAYISDVMNSARESLNEYNASFKAVQEKIEGATVIIGAVSTSSTDSGLNQYEDNYPRTGMHYTLLNQILSSDFVDDSTPVAGILIAFVLCFFYLLVSKKINGTGKQLVFGFGMIVFSIVLLYAVFALSRVYAGAVVPVVSITLTFTVTTIISFLTASKDKKFITNAFGQCLSPEVVKEIVANPSSFKLGGQKLEMTAIFTDIQKFSSFSELLTASQLVALLNYYLTQMSDIIMEERGTVDKYEGDAIIALVGAPVKMEDHARHAVRAALKMKAAEKIMNQEIKRIAAAEKPASMDEELYTALKVMVQNNKEIFTRIGLNSGEMIAGYMGSENKKNYTMMGNNVNLASRLEGVNKQYSTGGILMSEATRNLLGNDFIVRRLDNVRVVNVNTPIRLYEPLEETSKASEKLVKYVERWEQAISRFEEENYSEALQIFQALSQINPDDNVAKYYISLISTFFMNGSYPKESDNFGVEYIPQDKVFKLLQK